MRFLIFIAAMFLLSCGQGSSGKKEDPPKDDTAKKTMDTTKKVPVVKELPVFTITPDETAVNETLRAKYGTEWLVLNDQKASWMKEAFEYFIVPKRKEFPDYPYITKGDFNADGKQDTAAVVTDSLKKTYRVAILLGNNKTILWGEDVLEDAALSTVPKSVIDGMDGEKTKKVKLKGDGINVEYFEKASFVLYWDKSSFKRIQTSD